MPGVRQALLPLVWLLASEEEVMGQQGRQHT
jgi:hypothetical protein